MSKFLNSSLKLFRGNFVKKIFKRSESCDTCGGDCPKKPESHFIGQEWLQLPLFTPAFIMKHYEIVPLVLIALGGLAMNLTIAARTALTRDDVRWMTNGKFACERKPDFDHPPRRKFFIFNQKYKFSEGLREALKEPQAEPEPAKKKK